MAELNRSVDISFVIPVYRSEACLDALTTALLNAGNKMGRTFEIILANDGSPDRSWEKVVEIAQRFDVVKGVNLRRNFGQDNALMAGLTCASGRVIVIMDDDLQHDPADAALLIAQVEQGADVCYGRFSVKRQAPWKNAGSWFNDKVANVMLGKPKHVYLSPYKALSSEVVREILDYAGPYPYVDGLLFRVTDNIVQVDVPHHRRHAGTGNFTLRKSIATWMNLATSFSIAPLRLATYLGFMFSVVGLGAAAWLVIKRSLGAYQPLGWASTMSAVLVLGGAQLACLGLLGEYLGRVFLHLNRRPQFVVKEYVNVSPADEPQSSRRSQPDRVAD